MAIGVGDLVMVVRHEHRSCAVGFAKNGGHHIFGVPFTVTAIVGAVACPCGWRRDEPIALGFKRFGVPTAWLRRIDPLPHPEKEAAEAGA